MLEDLGRDAVVQQALWAISGSRVLRSVKVAVGLGVGFLR